MIFGCGYVGTALAAHCLASGVRVGALTRNPETAAHLRAMGVEEVIEGDLADPDWHARVQGHYEAVVNCVSSAGGGVAGYRKSYLEGQRAILEWCAGRGIRSYVYTSSTSVYPQDGGVIVDESADTREAPETGQILLQSEQLVAEAAARLGRWYVLRLAGIYGPGRHHLLDQLRDGPGVIPGRGDYTLNLIHLDDIVAAICAALANSRAPSGIYNIADDSPETKASLMNWLADALGLPAPRFDPDQVSARLQRRGGRMPDRKILNAKAKRELGWAPKYPSFREGYRAMLK